MDDFKFDENDPDGMFGSPLGEPGKGDADGADEEKLVGVAGVYEHRSEEANKSSEFVVLLRDELARTVLIVIGRFEAMAISLALEGHSADRPLTHDLLNNVIGRLGGTLRRILIDDLWNDTYYAKITIDTPAGELVVDSRPSDAIALALRAKAPIYMLEHVLREAGLRAE